MPEIKKEDQKDLFPSSFQFLFLEKVRLERRWKNLLFIYFLPTKSLSFFFRHIKRKKEEAKMTVEEILKRLEKIPKNYELKIEDSGMGECDVEVELDDFNKFVVLFPMDDPDYDY